jgi:4,5:9,10-diseco-3-hydroxy-5,9,17-trioxoandrosta-1(10),2-diene-4-oate hydrolase
VVWGRQDNTLPVSEAAEFRRRLPHGTVDVIDGCGHALTLDCPDQVIALMTGFIRGG